jgi:hypothetical protein
MIAHSQSKQLRRVPGQALGTVLVVLAIASGPAIGRVSARPSTWCTTGPCSRASGRGARRTARGCGGIAG